MNTRLVVAMAVLALLSSDRTSAYEIGTHALMTQRAYTRSVLADPAGAVQQRLGLDRLDPSGPFATAIPYSLAPRFYYDNDHPANPPAIPAILWPRDVQPFERQIFQQLLNRQFFAAPASDSSIFGPSDTAVVRFETTLPAWLMRGAIREDDYGAVVRMGTPSGAPRDFDPWGEILRVTRHFYDPVHNIALTVPAVPVDEKATDWALGMTDALDVQEPEATTRRQHFSLHDFYNNLYWALTLERPHDGSGPRLAADKKADSVERKRRFATAFKSLGHVVHLLQDMGQPQHVRNDQHLGVGFIPKRLFEPYTEVRVTQDFDDASYTGVVTDFYGIRPPRDWFPQPVLAGASGDYPIPMFPHAIGFFTTRNPVDSDGTIPQRKGMADFDNRNFFSVGTLPGDTNFPYPSTNLATYSQVQIGSAMVINNQRTTNFYLTQTVQDSLAPGFQDALPSYTAGKVPLLSLSQLQDLADLTSAATNEVSLDLTNYQMMADVNIPRAIGYSAGMMNFALRGNLGVLAPTDRAVAVLNQGATHTMNTDGYPCVGSSPSDGCAIFGFEKVRVRLRNDTAVITDPVSGTPISQGTGSNNGSATVVAVARYHRNTCYKPDLSGERVQPYAAPPALVITEPTCAGGQTVRTDYQEVSVSAPLTIAIGELDNLAANTGVDKLFDFAADPIPVNATDLFIQVVYRGPLGAEASSVAVGMLDVREPTFVAFWNNTDYFWNGSNWLAHNGTYPNEGVKDFWACTGSPSKYVFFYQGAMFSPAMTDPVSGGGTTGVVRLGFVFPPPDFPAQLKSIRGVPVHYGAPSGPVIPLRSTFTSGVFRQANKEKITAATLAAPYPSSSGGSCSGGLPSSAEYWCFDPIQKRRNQLLGTPMQPLYLEPTGSPSPTDVDAAGTQTAFTGTAVLATGDLRFNTDATLLPCPSQPLTIAPDGTEDPNAAQHLREIELLEEARELGVSGEHE